MPAHRNLLLPVLAASLSIAACDSPVRPSVSEPLRPSLLVSDGAHGGSRHFYFLPPLVPAPAYAGIPDGTLAPLVEICDLGTAPPSAASVCLGSPVAAFTKTTGTAGEVIRYDEPSQQYLVTWKTDHSDVPLQSGRYYRIHVRVAGTLLGYADVTPVDNGSALRHYTTSDIIALVNGRTLPIKFRIEAGAVYVVEPPPSGALPATVTSLDGQVTMAVPAGAISEPLGITIQPASLPAAASTDGLIAGTAYHFGPTGTAFAEPITVTVRYNPAAVPETRGAASLRLVTLVDGSWIVVPGSTVDTVAHTVTAPLSHFSIFALQSIRRVAVTMYDDSYGEYAVYLVYEDGLGLEFLVFGRTPAWSPDGTQIAFVYGGMICVIAPDGSGYRVLPGTESVLDRHRLSWSSDGMEIAFNSIGERTVRRVAANGVSLPVTVYERVLEYVTTPDWSLFRNQIVFSGDWAEGEFVDGEWAGQGDLYLINPDGSGLTRLTNTPDWYEWSPNWSADGSKLVFAFQARPFWVSNEPQTMGLLDLATNTTSIVIDDLLNSLAGDEDLQPVFTPHGKISFYSRGPVGNRNGGSIWTINPDGTGLTRVIDGDAILALHGLKLGSVESWEP